jgi:hypothetical protein
MCGFIQNHPVILRKLVFQLLNKQVYTLKLYILKRIDTGKCKFFNLAPAHFVQLLPGLLSVHLATTEQEE